MRLPMEISTPGMAVKEADLPEVILRTVVGLSVVRLRTGKPWGVHRHWSK